VLLQAYSSHLRTHGHLVIGLALIILGILEIKPYLDNPWESSVCLLLGLNVYRGYMFYFCIFLASSAFWFVLIRHFVYGALIDTTINASPHNGCAKNEQKKEEECKGKKTAVQKLDEEVTRRVENERHILGLPCSWYYGSWSLKRTAGAIFCSILGILATLFVYVLLG